VSARLRAALAVALLLAGVSSAAETLELSSELRLRVRAGSRIELEVLPALGEGYASIARRICGSADAAEALTAWNEGAAVVEGRPLRVPLALLSDEYRALALERLFPRDRFEGDHWIHLARSGELSTWAEGLWQVAEWFTGDGNNFSELQRVNGLASPELAPGQSVRIPASLLHAALRRRPRSDDGLLEYGSDPQGPFAGYRLRPGEALYSAVVVRFTGRSGAEDVNALAERIAARSGIRDLRDIPAGYLVKIELDLLEPEFLPAGHPRRLAAEAAREELARELAQRPVEETRGGLEGVLVVLDPGHGGRDLGTMHNGVWEHDYVYDVTCRLKHKIERSTAARVVLTLEDAQTGCVPSNGDKLTANLQGTVLTDPPFLAREEGEARIGVNLRWYLANSIHRRAVREGVDPDRVVFLSIHADSRHPSLRGAMIYVPGADYRTGTYTHNSKTYRRYREVREKPSVKFSRKERVRSEAVSSRLAGAIVRSLAHHGLPVQKHQPIRNRIIRGRKSWLPAVIRGNEIPTKVLVELVNIGNGKDARLLAEAAARDRMADALLDSLFRHFGETPPGSVAARSARP